MRFFLSFPPAVGYALCRLLLAVICSRLLLAMLFSFGFQLTSSVGYCPDEVHVEDEEVEVKAQVQEEEMGETHGREQDEEQGENKQSSRTHG